MPKRGDLYPADDDMAEYLSYLRDGDYQDLATGIWKLSNYQHLLSFTAGYELRPKRGRYGNKYADNK